MQHATFDDDSKKRRKELIIEEWQNYLLQFPSEEDCVEELIDRIYVDGVFCCGDQEVVRIYGARTFKCRSCRKTTWLLAGTFFENIRRARPWLGRIWLLERGIAINSFEFHTVAGVATSTSLEIFKRIGMVLDDAMKGGSVVHSDQLIAVICKRSRETPRREHPRAELQLLEIEGSESVEEADVHSELIDPITKDVLELVSFDEQNSFDDIHLRSGLSVGQVSASLVLLELDGLVTRGFGDTYIRSKRARRASKQEQDTVNVDDLVRFIAFHFQGVSRRNLQFYIATYWYLSTQERDLLGLCSRFRKLSRKEVTGYLSPTLLKVA